MPTDVRILKVADHELTLHLDDTVFNPTTTTLRLAEHVDLAPEDEVLDLGCGVGPLAIYCAKQGASHVTAVDIMPDACKFAERNVQENGVADRVTVKCGDLFEPVQGRHFDVIVNDVSGIADLAARLSNWYPQTIPTGGDDGTDVVNRMLSASPDYIKPGGRIYFATSSLSNVKKIIDHAEQCYPGKVEKLDTYRFPFSPDLVEAIDQLQEAREQGKIDFDQRRSRYLWLLEIFRIQVD